MGGDLPKDGAHGVGCWGASLPLALVGRAASYDAKLPAGSPNLRWYLWIILDVVLHFSPTCSKSSGYAGIGLKDRLPSSAVGQGLEFEFFFDSLESD